MLRAAFVVVGLGLVATATPAHAGRSFFGWLYGPEVLPERGVELQTWTWEENRDHDKNTSFLWAPFIGITDQLEIGLPVTARWIDMPAKSFTIDTYGIEARYRFVTMDPVDKPEFAPLARVAVKRDVLLRSGTILEGDIVGAYDIGDSVQILADAGFYTELSRDVANQVEIRPGVGVSVAVWDELRFGAEGYGELQMTGEKEKWYAVGPNMAYTHGRMWLSAAYGIGITGIKTAPRFQWGIAF